MVVNEHFKRKERKMHTKTLIPVNTSCKQTGQLIDTASRLTRPKPNNFVAKMSQIMILWYLSHRRTAKAQARLRGLARAFAVRTHKVWK